MKKFFVVFTFLVFSPFVFGQEALKSLEEDYFDFLSLQGVIERPYLNYRTLSDSKWDLKGINENEKNVWKKNNLGNTFTLFEPETKSENAFLKGVPQGIYIKPYGPEWFNSVNTDSPYGQNDGALWQGRGYNTSFTTGVRFEGYGLEFTFKPQLNFSQNAGFEFKKPEGFQTETYKGKASDFGYIYGYGIDMPQRFGNDPFFIYDWGDTEIRYSWKTLTAGFGTETIWLGPAWLNPMLHSNNAGSYPKFDIGLRKQKVVIPWLNWNLGYVECRLWIGQLSESDYFDKNPYNDLTQLTGFNLSWAPSFIPGLTLGLTKVCLNPWGRNFWRYMNPFYDSNEPGEFGEDQKMSITMDWLFPSVGFEVYGELGKDDYSSEKLANPFHTVVYTVGAKKTLPLLERFGISSELIFELNNFEMSQDFQMQWQYMGYYTHSQMNHGYTNRGQILGAGSGSFGNSQYVGLSFYHEKFALNFSFHRHSPDNNFIYNKTVGSSINHESPEYKIYWGRFKTYKSIGGEITYFVNKSLQISVGYYNTWINFPQYNEDDDVGDFNNHFTLFCKYTL